MEGPFSAYQGDDPYVFVSYAHEDAALVFPELIRLRDAGFNVWYDEGIRPGSTWREEVALALSESRLFIYFLTERSVRSENCQQELNFALSRERKVLAVHLTPVQLTAGIELSLSNKQAIIRPELDDNAYAAKLLGAVQFLMPVTPVELPFATSPAETNRESIAILPFTNRSSDPENDYLCDGIVEELMIGLTRVDGLAVASQLQTYAYKNSTADIREIGRKLKTLHVLNGSVQKSGQRIRVSVTLSETEHGNALWSERYDGTIDDVFELQEDVAEKVLDALKLKFISGGVSPDDSIIDLGTSSSQAYHYFLLGRYEAGKGTLAGDVQALDYLARALEEDPGFGRAAYYEFFCMRNLRDAGHFAGQDFISMATKKLEDVYASGFEPPFPRRWFEREIDPSLNDALSQRDRLAEVIADFNDSSSNSTGYKFAEVSMLLAGAGLINSSCDFIEAYAEKFPEHAANTTWHNPYTANLFSLGRFEQAIEVCSSVYAKQPNFIGMLVRRAMLYSRSGQYTKAAADLADLAKTFPRNFAQFYDLYCRQETEAAQELYEWLMSRKNLPFMFRVQACFLMGEINRGIEEIKSVPRTSGQSGILRVGFLHCLPESIKQQVNAHPEYQALLTAAGVDDAWQNDLMVAMNDIKHLTGIHVQPDEDR